MIHDQAPHRDAAQETEVDCFALTDDQAWLYSDLLPVIAKFDIV